MATQNESKIVKTVCNMCQEKCGINVYVENGKIVRISGMQEHFSHILCPRAYAIPEMVYSPERVISPLRKKNGEFKEVSWDEALDFIADKLTHIKEKYGPQALVTHLGVPFVRSNTQGMMRRFDDLYGTPNYTTGATFCWWGRSIGEGLTWGERALPNYLDFVETKCTILWGTDVRESRGLLPEYRLREEMKRGAKLIVVDPRAVPMAKEADIHAQLRPGTDCALALGMLNVIIAEGLYDKAFVEQWTIGFDKLVEQVKDYTPEKVEPITLIKADTIRKMARMYATSKPAQIIRGISLDHCTNGCQAIRATAILTAITGNLDVPGGEVTTPPLKTTNLRLPEKLPKGVRPVGAEFPLFTKFTLEQSFSSTADQILTEKPYPIKALITAGVNPVLTYPNTNKFKRAREKLELVAVCDVFMTDTAKMADVVLPGATFLEKLELKLYLARGFSLAVLGNQAIEPVGKSMDEWQIIADLGKRMGYGEYFPWKNTEELFEWLLKPTNITLELLRRTPGGVNYWGREFRQYLKGGFNTPSKKVEIYSQTMKDLGYDPLPTFHEPEESPVSRPDLAKKYPLIFVSGHKTEAYTHSQYRNLPSLRKLVPEPLLEINTQTAASLGIANGDFVKAESLRGSIKVKAKVTKDILPGVVAMQHGWSEANANLLTNDETHDPVLGDPGIRSSTLCRVTKA